MEPVKKEWIMSAVRCSAQYSRFIVLIAALFCAAGSTPARGAIPDEELLRLVETKWEPKMKPYVQGSSSGGYTLDWEGFKGSLPDRLKAHFARTNRLPASDPDVQAIMYAKASIPKMNVVLEKMRREPQAARIGGAGCVEIGTNDSFTSIELKLTGTCAKTALNSLRTCKLMPFDLPWPLNKLLRVPKLPKKLCVLLPKAEEHLSKCGYGGFKIKYYPLRNKWNIGC